MCEGIGSEIKALRENMGWSQYQLAQKIPLSQKQISRIEHGEVVGISRATLIRLGEVLESPVADGELNRWLHLQGYRAYLRPGLPLPPGATATLTQMEPYPAALVDIGGHLVACNGAMERAFGAVSRRVPLGRNLAVDLLRHSSGRLLSAMSEQLATKILRRLLWEWSFFADEDWVYDMHATIGAALGTGWEAATLGWMAPLARPAIDEITWPLRSASPGRFIAVEHAIRRRPDLGLFRLHPANAQARVWCAEPEERVYAPRAR